MHKLLGAIWCGVMLAGCQTTAEGDAISKAQMRVPPDYRMQTVKFFQGYLKDPYSVRSAEISAPMEQFTGLINGGTRPAVCARFNAKNAFGAYVGARSFVVWFDNGKVQNVIEEFIYACNSGVVYHPFPEMEADQRAVVPPGR